MIKEIRFLLAVEMLENLIPETLGGETDQPLSSMGKRERQTVVESILRDHVDKLGMRLIACAEMLPDAWPSPAADELFPQ